MMKNIKTHIEYLEEKSQIFQIAKMRYNNKKTKCNDEYVQNIIKTVRGYILFQNPTLYSYVDKNVDDSEFFSEKHFGDELNKLIQNLKRETVK
jgi:hypothetical protein